MAEYALAFALILDGNSVYHAAVHFNLHLPVACVGLVFIALVLGHGWLFVSTACRRTAFFAGVYFLSYLVLMHQTIALEQYGCMFVAGLPLLLLYLGNQPPGRETALFSKLGNLLFLFSWIWMALWLVGDILHLIEPDFSIEVMWGTVRPVPGYFGLSASSGFDTTYGFDLPRNRGFFCEAPMLSLWMSLALMNELFLCPRPRKNRIFSFSLCILTSISTTGVLFLFLVFGLKYWESYLTRFKGNKLFAIVILAVLLPVAIGFILDMMAIKSETGSFRTRLSDYEAVYHMFKDHPLLGGGYGNGAQIYALGYKQINIHGAVGMSNSLMVILATGGLWNATVFVWGIFGLAIAGVKKAPNLFAWALCYLYLLATTSFAARFINAVLLAYSIFWWFQLRQDSPRKTTFAFWRPLP